MATKEINELDAAASGLADADLIVVEVGGVTKKMTGAQVADGDAIASTYATIADLASLDTRVDTAESDINALESSVAAVEGDVATLQTDVAALPTSSEVDTAIDAAIANQPEVVDRADEPLAEVPPPNPIGHHSRRERMLRLGKPPGQFEPPASVFRQRGLAFSSKDDGETAWNDRPGRQVTAAAQERYVRWFAVR